MWLLTDTSLGWSTRMLHANIAACVFAAIYNHLLRGVVQAYAPRTLQAVWYTGCFLIVGMMGLAFCGYVLPWGSMSYWALTVITNLIAVVPAIGSDLLEYVWGGYYVTTATLSRFFC